MIDLKLVGETMHIDIGIIAVDLKDGGFILSVASSKKLVLDLTVLNVLGITTLNIDETILEFDRFLVGLHKYILQHLLGMKLS